MFQLTNIVFYDVILPNQQQFNISTQPLHLRPFLFSDAYLLEASNFFFFFKVARAIHCPEEKNYSRVEAEKKTSVLLHFNTSQSCLNKGI